MEADRTRLGDVLLETQVRPETAETVFSVAKVLLLSAVDSSDVVLSAVTVNVLSVGVDMSAKAAYSAVDSSGAHVLGEARFSAADSGSIQMFAAFPSVLAGSIQAVNFVFSVGDSSDVDT